MLVHVHLLCVDSKHTVHFQTYEQDIKLAKKKQKALENDIHLLQLEIQSRLDSVQNVQVLIAFLPSVQGDAYVRQTRSFCVFDPVDCTDIFTCFVLGLR